MPLWLTSQIYKHVGSFRMHLEFSAHCTAGVIALLSQIDHRDHQNKLRGHLNSATGSLIPFNVKFWLNVAHRAERIDGPLALVLDCGSAIMLHRGPSFRFNLALAECVGGLRDWPSCSWSTNIRPH